MAIAITFPSRRRRAPRPRRESGEAAGWRLAVRALRIRNYRLYVTGNLVSVTGTWMQLVAQNWLVLRLTGSASALGITVARQAVPGVLFSLHGGGLADRVSKRRILVLTQTTLALLAATLGVLVATGAVKVWMVYAPPPPDLPHPNNQLGRIGAQRARKRPNWHPGPGGRGLGSGPVSGRLPCSLRDDAREVVVDTALLDEAVERLRAAQTLLDIQVTVRTAARKIARAEGATFVLRDGDECFYADEDAMSPLWKGQRFPLTQCISGWAMLNDDVAIIPDITEDERVPIEAYRPTFVKSLAMVPVGSPAPLAAIGTYWARVHRPTDEQRRMLCDLASEVAAAIERVGLQDAPFTPSYSSSQVTP